MADPEKYSIIGEMKTLDGIVKRHPDGFGFFIPDDSSHPDVYIPKQNMGDVMTNDRVQVEVHPDTWNGKFRGEIRKILSRSLSKVMGKLSLTPYREWIIKDVDNSWGANLQVKIPGTIRANEGELAIAKILSYPNGQRPFLGEVVEILGSDEDPLLDIKKVIFNNQIPFDFSSGTEAESKKFDKEIDRKLFGDRVDLTSKNFITIDGVTAKDFDDAILVESTPQGFHLWVAIADVSHYVKPGSEIDKDAYIRGTSVYFPGFVVPMLPEVLSNGLCSLKPDVFRFVVVSEIKMDFSGVVKETKFYEAVIQSKARVTYGEAQEVIDGQAPEKLRHVEDMIKKAADLAKILLAKRMREGSLELEIPETEILLDSTGNVVDIIRSERLFAHRLIEEMMLSANVAVAKFFEDNEIPAIYRIHESPAQDNIDTLNRFLETFGSGRQISGHLQKSLTRSLQELDNPQKKEILNILTLRSMKQAKYSPDNVGHFGLGFSDYTHFTSPIRRYPDLIVHRLLKSLIVPKKGYSGVSYEELATNGVHLSACEQRSTKAERQFKSIKRARFIHQHLGKEFEGVINSVNKFGFFVLLRQFDVDGLVKIDDLKGYFEFDEDSLELVNTKTGYKFCLGDSVKIQVARTDLSNGKIDFLLIEHMPEGGKSSASGFERRERSSDRRDRGSERRNLKRRSRDEDAESFSGKGSRRKFRGKSRSSRNGEAEQSGTRQGSGVAEESQQNSRRKSYKPDAELGLGSGGDSRASDRGDRGTKNKKNRHSKKKKSSGNSYFESFKGKGAKGKKSKSGGGSKRRR